MTWKSFFPLTVLFACSCTGGSENNIAKSADSIAAVHAASSIEDPKSSTTHTFDLIRQYPTISDTAAFVKQLQQVCGFEEGESPKQNESHMISYYKRIKLNGSDNVYILLEYNSGVGSMASYPWKHQALFSPDGRLIRTFSALRFELLTVFPGQNPFLLTLITTAKGNGGHELYRIHADSLDNVYEGYYNFKLPTYDAHEDNSVYEPNELRIKISDRNNDGANDLVFNGSLVLIRGRTSGGEWYDSLKADHKTIGYSIKNPFSRIPVEYIFLYDKRTGHFKAKENYNLKYSSYR